MSRRVYLVDDDRDFRESARWWLEGLDCEVTEFADATACLSELADARPAEGCLMLDIRMPGLTGLQLAEALEKDGVRLPTIYVTGHADIPLAVEAMRRGAVTFLEKPVEETALSDALDLAFGAGAGPSEPAADTPEARAYRERLALLTPREREVFDLVIDGKINKVIAYELGISIKTVELHRKRVKEKMQAGSLPELMRMAMTGVVPGGEMA